MKLPFLKRRILTPEEKTKLRNERLLLILSGALLGLGFPPFPMPFPLLLFFALIPLLYVIEKRRALGDLNRAVYLTAFIFNLITIYWVGSWQKQADPFLMISGAALLFVNPALFLIPSTLLHFARKAFPGKETIYLLPFFWGAFEYAYMITDLSFPWLTLGNSLANFTVFVQAADIVGAIGLSLILLFINIFLYKALINFKDKRRKSIFNFSAAILIFSVVLGYGIFRLSEFKFSGKNVNVGLIQPNLDPWEKWEGGNLTGLTGQYLSLSQKAVNKGAKLIVWPETSLPVFLLDGSYDNIVDSIYSFVNRNNICLITGMPNVRYYNAGDKMPPDAIKAKNGYYYYAMYNGVLMFLPGTRIVQQYGKSKLVPFGERVPFVNALPFLGNVIKWGVGISGWNVGQDTSNFVIPAYPGLITGANGRVSDSLYIDRLVCYESIYPYYVANFIKKNADIIAVVTNDSWYGNSSGPYQHKDFSILRAVENRRTVVRAANGGISCIIDPLGRVKTQSGMFTETFITGNAPLEFTETFFTKYPLLIPTICSVISIWILGIYILKRIKVRMNI